MELNTKFDVGRNVYVIRNQSTYKNKLCTMCDGEGSVIAMSPIDNEKRNKIICPECHGRKLVQGDLVNRYSIEETVVTGIKISIREKSGIHISYKVKADNSKGEVSYPEKENMICGTEQEANAICEGLNKESAWHYADNHPKADTDIIVRDKDGKEYDNHRWNEHYYL